MKKFIVLQAGHQNIKSNCNVTMRPSTGAPGEAEFTVRVRDRLSAILIEKGFALQLVDANFNCSPEAKKKIDLFLAIHYDADSPNGQGGCIGAPDPSLDDATKESVRIRDTMRSEYFKHSGIVENNAKIGVNITKYYMWASLAGETPCVLIECGEGKDPHDSVILADTDRVCNAIARGICKAFDVPFDAPVPTPEPLPTPSNDTAKIIEEIKKEVLDVQQKMEHIKNLLTKV